MSTSNLLRRALMVLAFLLAVAPASALAQPEKPPLYFEVPSSGSTTLLDVARTTLGSAQRWPEIVELNPDLVRPDGKPPAANDRLPAGTSILLPGDARTGDPNVGTKQSPNQPNQAAQPPAQQKILGMTPVVAYSVGGGVLVLLIGGGVTFFLLRRKGRKPKKAVVAPVSVDDPKPRMVLDRALRHLVVSGSPIPQVYGAVVGPDRISLRLTPPQPQATHPWRTREEGAVWEAPTWQLDPTTPNVPPPFPLLVSVGTIGGEWTAVNLGRAPGLVALTGEPGVTGQAAAALLEQVAADPGVGITVIGRVPKARLAPGRVRVVQSAEELLGGNRRNDNPDVTGMLAGNWQAAPSRLSRHLVLVNAPLPPADVDRLGTLAAMPDLTSAVLVVGDVATAAWRFGIADDGAFDIGVLGLELDSAKTDA
ncbi:transmembrane domain-containing protein [Lentzea sp. JNUCC 0626]|uniref:EGFR-like transmembrane domain-containing protein n=1 Tax=Lentzea sp. JNUCC 0626 TaxID=3367513 RepID=UPI003749F60E